MKVSDPQFGNLFARLSKYTPSEGEKRKLEPIENFCTEALAFFLIQSNDFRNRFVSDLLGLKDVSALAFDIETQCSEGYSGYADLVLTIRNSDRRIGIEVKLDADFQKDQLARMVKAFGEDAFLLAPELFVRSNREKIDPYKIAPALNQMGKT